ncbi:MAG: GGDEF domain-containing protein, partial [Gammaproteobacteria bacterium]|nr:GGDEF domain-containing protein [Gammaproteobacteria bacterium]
NDISKLKNSIKDQINSIKTGVSIFITRDNDRYQISEQRNNRLQQKIKSMEQESDKLQQKLYENKQKLMFDTLTGARSRLSYDEILEQELQRWTRYKDEFSFALLDIDHFKRVNDQFGHNAGDKALQIVAKMMSKHIRKTDFLFRIGGEEFVLLLPKTNLQNAQPLVEKIRASVGSSSFHFKQKKVEISLSAGLTTITTGDHAESIYERADKALYEAKNGGRDQLVVKSA